MQRIIERTRMLSANVIIHQSQFPENVRRDLIESLRTRRVNHKFHYDSVKQTQKWLALHQVYSPSRNDADCAATYDLAFAEAVSRIESNQVHLIGLGCGGGQKDTRLLKMLLNRGSKVAYTPCDVSTAMVLTARQTALAVVPEHDCFPFVCDFAKADDLAMELKARQATWASGLITFFGMIPNFEPEEILPKLAKLMGQQDWLLFSANLAPGADYGAGVQKILPQYDNELMREWLLTFLFDLGVERGDGELRFSIEEHHGLRRIVARYCFARRQQIQAEGIVFDFQPAEEIQLFFSFRYTPEHVRENLFKHGIEVRRQWITKSGEEGVFLCSR
jgi:L-histidine Nalpha-methyltransferase